MRNDGDLLLWQSFKQGDWDAYSRLYNAYFGLLNNYGFKFTKEKELIEDAVHDLFVRLWTMPTIYLRGFGGINHGVLQRE